MKIERQALLLMLLPAVMGLRDPFQPAEDKCQTGQLEQWRYGGAINSDAQTLGLLKDAAGKWHRVTQGQRLGRGWEVLGIQSGRIDIMVGQQCEPSRWHWLKEGVNHALQDSAGIAADDHDSRRKGKNDRTDG